MDEEFFQRKIKDLTDDKLIGLLQKTGNDLNQEVFELAKEEAGRRGLEFKLIDKADNASLLNESNDTEKLSKWNWGSLFPSSYLDFGQQIRDMDNSMLYTFREYWCHFLFRL
uniref:hypothetical protein n=1 Tax=Roseivirga sp. TaxID=1964215 RepID=UPI004048D01C